MVEQGIGINLNIQPKNIDAYLRPKTIKVLGG